MTIEVFHHRKPRSDSALKSFSQDVQNEIVQYAQGRSLREVQVWLQEKHHVKRALSNISDFLSWSRTIERRYGNQGAIEALVAPLGPDGAESTDTPELTEEEIRTHARRYFLESIVHDCNISAWHQSERIALKREEMELKQQQLELKRQELELKREQLELKRKIHERKQSPESRVQSPKSAGANIQHSTLNIQHSIAGETPDANSDKSRSGLQLPEKRQSLAPNVEPLNLRTERGSVTRSNLDRQNGFELVQSDLTNHIAAGHRPALRFMERGIVGSREEVPLSRFDGFDAFDGLTKLSVNRGKSCKIVANRIKRSGVQNWRPVKTRPTCCQTQSHSNQSRLHHMKVDKGEKMYADAGYHPGYA